MKPRIALVVGDPGGIGAEVAVRLLASEAAGRAAVLVVGDPALLERGMREAGVSVELEMLPDLGDFARRPRTALLARPIADPEALQVGSITAAGGRACIENLALAVDLARDGLIEGIVFTPFSKQAIRLVLPDYQDEAWFLERRLGLPDRVAEFNVIDAFWNARVTSHVPLRRVAELITEERIVDRLRLTDRTLRASGIPAPVIAVAALNPHAGDGGAFGTEELEIISPAVERARREGLRAEGPFPADTLYLRAARSRRWHAVLSMYHDQGQIAVKLLGFEQGVTLLGGLPFPVTTPAHGTALDIAGRGIADPRPTIRAFELVLRLVERRPADGGTLTRSGESPELGVEKRG